MGDPEPVGPGAGEEPPVRPVVAGIEVVLTLAGVVYRGYGLTQVAVALLLSWQRYPCPHTALLLGVALVAENLVVLGCYVYRRRVLRGLTAADAVWNSGAILAGTWLTWLHLGNSWINFMYPYTVIGSVLIGFAFRRYRFVFVVSSVLAASYLVADVLAHHDAVAAIVPNVLGYYANTAAAYLVARYLRRVGAEFDASRTVALSRARALGRERERARHARLLHDRVLQTFEALSRGDWVKDVQFRRHIAAEAAWLRDLVEGVDSRHSDDLLAGLRRLVQQRALTGLHVDLNTAQLREDGQWRTQLTTEAATALVDAAHEALTNVAKHAGVDHAMIRVGLAGPELTLSVLDRGCGFDPATARRGIGLTESISKRINDVGGTVRIDSGADGTYVELTVPLP